VVILLVVALSLVVFSSGIYQSKASNKKLLIGYFLELYKYDPHGADYPLPPNVTNPLQLLEEEMGEIIPLYDVIVQAFISPSDYVNGQIIDDPYIKAVREGVNGSKGLMELCQENGVQLAISIGGGGAPQIIPDSPSEFPPLIDALYEYVTKYGYTGIDIDEENAVDVDTYNAFMIALGKRFHNTEGKNLTVSCTIGPLSCCYEARGMCGTEDYIDWIFLMLYDGLTNSAAFNISTNEESFIWQNTDGQTFCGITTNSSSQYGFVGNVATGACQFINFAMYLNWPYDRLIMGLPSYSYPGVFSWFQLMEGGETPTAHDSTTLLTQFSNGVWIPSGQDIATRCSYVLDPNQSQLGVTLTNTGWQSKIENCFPGGEFAGETILGAGFWQIGLEDRPHHELSAAARKIINGINDNL